MITVDQALKIVLARAQPLGIETIELALAHNRILAEDIIADINLPPFDRARMDGYAVRSADAAIAPATLRVVGEIAAGASFDRQIRTGEAVKIFTGAPMPEGADAVQKIEATDFDGDYVTLKEAVKPGQFVTPRASEMSAGAIAAGSGREIGPAELAALASFGYAKVKVGRRPRVAIISTGSELVDVSTSPSGPQIRNSNSYTLAAYAQRAGAIVDNLGAVEDTPQATRDALSEAARGRDVVITSGGVSMGDYDLVKAALVEIGAKIHFDKVIIRPGKPTVFAERDQTLFFGLPGNPVSTSVTFNVFARAALRKMQGEFAPHLPTVRAKLTSAIQDHSSRRSFLPAALRILDGAAFAEPLKWGGSSDLVAFMNADALIIVGEQMHELEAGEAVDVMMLGAAIKA